MNAIKKIIMRSSALEKLFALGAVAFVFGCITSAMFCLLSIPLTSFLNPALPFPYAVLAIASIYYHRTHKSFLYTRFSQLSKAAIIFALSAMTFASLALISHAGFLGFSAKTITAIGAWLLGAAPIEFSRAIFADLVLRLTDTNEKNLGDAMVARINQLFANNENHLKRGDIEAASRQAYPESVFPELYASIKADIVRPTFSDSRLITGQLMSHLAPRRLSESIVRKLFNQRMNFFALRAMIVFPIVIAFSIALGFGSYAQQEPMLEAKVAALTAAGSVANNLHQEFWNEHEQAAAITKATDELQSKKTVMTWAGKLLLFVLSGITGIASFGLIFSLMMLWLIGYLLSPRGIRGGLNAIINMDDNLLIETKESVVRYKKRLDTRLMEQRGYREQIVAANADQSPMISIGTGTGTILFRGGLQGYSPDQPVEVSLQDMNTAMLVAGATGSGKTFSILMPILRQVMGMRPKNQALAIFTMCAKGVFSQDTVNIAKEFSRESRVIGHKENEWGVDLFDGLDPVTIQTSLVEIVMQLSGGASDSQPIFKDMAAQILGAAAVLAQAYECTPAGTEEIARTGERIFSPVGIARIALSARQQADGYVYRIIEGILSCVEKDPAAIACYCGVGLVSALEFFRVELPTYPKETLGSFLVNVTNMLGGFLSHEGLRSNFGAASSGKMLEISDVFLDRAVTTVGLSTFDGGPCARVALIFIKMRIYHAARVRNAADPDIAKKSKLFLIFDEAQEVITSGGTYGEASILGYARSTGLSFVMAFPGLPSIYSAMGEGPTGQKTQKILEQCRTQVYLASQGAETVDHVKKIAGTTLRGTVSADDQHESFLSRRYEQGNYSADDNIAPYELEMDDQIKVLPTGNIRGKITAEMRSPIRFESEFYASSLRGSMAQPASVDWVEKQRALQQRQDDKHTAFLSQGNAEESLIRTEDLTMLGRGQAFAIVQRAGHTRMDFIRTNPYAGMIKNVEKPSRAADENHALLTSRKAESEEAEYVSDAA